MKRKYVQAMMTGMTAMLAVTVPVTTVAAATPEKEQTVYVNADQNGNVEKVIVSNWLKNTDKESMLEDNSELNDITNVKGEEKAIYREAMANWYGPQTAMTSIIREKPAKNFRYR